MLFTELRFLPFFLLVFGVHWGLRRNGPRKVWLLATSYVFYAAWDWRFLSLIIASTLIDWFAGRGVHRSVGRARRCWLLLSLTGNLGILGFFKYCDFFLGSAAKLLDWLGLPVSLPLLEIVLPVGISFFTFQTMSYSLDIWRGKLEPARSLLDLALFVGFFPQLVAGPIVRAATFLPQLREPRRRAGVAFRPLLALFFWGFVKKACLSDHLAGVVDPYFAEPNAFDSAAAWLATLAYAAQIYCDFSGYSDMAIAAAGLLGYELCENFAFPYLARDIRDFWRRWHISLSSWLRDYLYVPLGGNRGSRLATHRNLMLTMLLGGLWHGAAWHFVVWGGLHGLALAAQRAWSRRVNLRGPAHTAHALLSPLLTSWFVCLGWIFFRAEDLPRAWIAARSFVLLDSPGSRTLDPTLWWGFAALLGTHLLARDGRLAALGRRAPDWLFAAALGAACSVALSFTQGNAQPFLYFQF